MLFTSVLGMPCVVCAGPPANNTAQRMDAMIRDDILMFAHKYSLRDVWRQTVCEAIGRTDKWGVVCVYCCGNNPLPAPGSGEWRATAVTVVMGGKWMVHTGRVPRFRDKSSHSWADK